MEILTGNFYFVSDSFFDKIKDPFLKMNYETTKRPHYFAFKYILNQYIRCGKPVKIINQKIISDIEHSAKRVIRLLRNGVKFTPTQPNAIRIEHIMLEELNNEQNIDK